MKKSNLGKPPKVNVIPILDAVFIFVFFLLMSAQFVELYELHTKKPLIEEVSSSQAADGKSKSYKIRLYTNKIVLTEGMNERSIGTYNWGEDSLEKLGKRLLTLKVRNPKENAIVIRPKNDVRYKNIVKVVDIAQKHYNTNQLNGKLFTAIAFEPMD